MQNLKKIVCKKIRFIRMQKIRLIRMQKKSAHSTINRARKRARIFDLVEGFSPPPQKKYVTYRDDEHVDNHGYDDKTDDDHDSNNDINVRALNARVNSSIYPIKFSHHNSRALSSEF